MSNLSPYTFYFELPIYTPIPITPENYNEFYQLLEYDGNIDAYNPNIKENTTYKVLSNRYRGILNFIQGGMNISVLVCARTKEEYFFYLYYDTQKKCLLKVGQYPSIADFHISQIKQYDKVLSKEKLKEFTRAIGLAANGVGIGSFVYLRRIFEDLIEEAHQKAKSISGWNEEDYSKNRMSEKIELLKDQLPAFLVENKSLYGILSVGIHSLEENQCLAYFDAVKTGIELILDEKVEAYEKQKKIEEARKRISSLTNQVQKG